MKKATCLGIWMDHAKANLMEITDTVETKIVESLSADKAAQGDSQEKGDKNTHHKEQQLLSAYYKKLGEVILNYDEVILFGPTDAKTELYNTLQSNYRFQKIKIDVKEADKMTENQQHAFVRDYFSKS